MNEKFNKEDRNQLKQPDGNSGAENFNQWKEKHYWELQKQNRPKGKRVSGLEDESFETTQLSKNQKK